MGQTHPYDKEWFQAKLRTNERGCMEWAGCRQRGYGKVTLTTPGLRDGVQLYAHRLSWELHRGPIPENLHVLHRCDNPPCCNPDHLFLGTIAQNQHDKVIKGRCASGTRQWKAKLTAAKVREIRYLHDVERQTSTSIAKRFGMSTGQISKINRNEFWSVFAYA